MYSSVPAGWASASRGAGGGGAETARTSPGCPQTGTAPGTDDDIIHALQHILYSYLTSLDIDIS